MTGTAMLTNDSATDNQALWNSLKTAIAKSSGFQCWQQEQTESMEMPCLELDQQVSNYLKETLETLAY
jgi:hypothetical protein